MSQVKLRKKQVQQTDVPAYLKPIDRDSGLGVLSGIDDGAIIQLFLPCFTISEICDLSLLSRTWLVLTEDDRLWKQFTLNRFGGEFWFEVSWKFTYVDMMYKHEGDRFKHKVNPFKGLTHEMYAKWSRTHFDMNQLILPFSHIDRRETMTVDQFIREYSSINKPVIITDAMNEWQAFKEFKRDPQAYKDYLLKQYGDVAFKTDGVQMGDWPHWNDHYRQYAKLDHQERLVEKRKKPSEELRKLADKIHEIIKMPLKMYMHYMERNRDEEPLYLFDGKFGERAPALLEDYKIPEYFKQDYFEQCLPTDKRPDFRWLVMGPKRSGSSWHMDPYLTSAWNALICGIKRWAFYPQGYLSDDLKEIVDDAMQEKQREIDEGIDSDEDETSEMKELPLPAYLQCSEPLEWITEEYLDAIKANKRPWECMQYPGEIIFVPSGWWHMVLNVDDTIAVTQNFVSDQNFASVYPDIKMRDKKMADVLKQKLLEMNRGDLFWFEQQQQQQQEQQQQQ